MFNDIANNSSHLSIIGGYVISIRDNMAYAYKLHTDDTCERVAYSAIQDIFYNEFGGYNMYRVYEYLIG